MKAEFYDCDIRIHKADYMRIVRMHGPQMGLDTSDPRAAIEKFFLHFGWIPVFDGDLIWQILPSDTNVDIKATIELLNIIAPFVEGKSGHVRLLSDSRIPIQYRIHKGKVIYSPGRIMWPTVEDGESAAFVEFRFRDKWCWHCQFIRLRNFGRTWECALFTDDEGGNTRLFDDKELRLLRCKACLDYVDFSITGSEVTNDG